MRATCVFTVVSLTNAALAISAFERPLAMYRSISRSRAVSSSSSGGALRADAGGRRTNSSITRRVIDGREQRVAARRRSWIASTSSSGGVSLSRKPLAPARSAS